MEIQKLNCPSCGGPIAIPDDLDVLNCASCGSALTVKRGDGYIALKMVEKVAQTIQQAGKETQSAIREGTAVTRMELQRLQFGQELSMAEMRLTSLRGELRNAQRETQTPVVTAQIRDLHLQEYYVLDKIRALKAQLAGLDCANPNEELSFVEEQFSLIRAELAVVRSVVPSDDNTRRIVTELSAIESRLAADAFALRVRAIKAGLKSYRLDAGADHCQASLAKQIDDINQDLTALSRQPASKEVDQVRNELRNRYNQIYKEWEGLENQRVADLLESLRSQPGESDLEAMRATYLQIQNDLRNLAAMPPNQVINQYRQQLQQRANNLYRKMEKLQKQAAREAAQAARAARGSEPASSDGSGFIKRMVAQFRGRAQGPAEASLTATPTDLDTLGDLPRPPLPRGSSVYIQGLILGLVPFIILFCASFTIYAAVLPPDSTGQGQSTDSPALAIPLFGTFIGYCLGAFLFFRRIAPRIRLLPPFPRATISKDQSTDRFLGARIGTMAGLAVIAGVLLLSLSIFILLPANVSGYSCLIIPVGLVFSIFYGRRIAHQVFV